jgi:hypothetical protein
MRWFRRHEHVWVFHYVFMEFLLERCECGAERIQELERECSQDS